MSEVWEGFYALEGIDGAGKSTAMELLRERAEKEGLADRIKFTSEPTKRGRAMLEAMRAGASPLPDTLSYLFAADRNQHLYGEGGIWAAIERGQKVVCDRYLFSSLVYQGIAGGEETAERLNSAFPLPEILFLFDIGAEEAFERIAARGGKNDAFERLEFLQKAEAEYWRLKMRLEVDEWDMRIVSIDALQPQEEIAEAIWREIWRQEQGRV